MSPHFLLFYGFSLILLAFYSLMWQLILRKFALTTAFSNKGIAVFWGILWGIFFFGENISIAKMIATVLIISGIIVSGKADG
jgi:drug/metabolite transporter (DMT)-like permease